MTLADLLPLARGLNSADRRVLAEAMWLSLEGEPVEPEVLDLVEARVAYIHQHPEECMDWSDFEKLMDARLGPISA
jgi:hypothetical protein